MKSAESTFSGIGVSLDGFSPPRNDRELIAHIYLEVKAAEVLIRAEHVCHDTL